MTEKFNQKQILDDLSEIVAIKSVYSEPLEGAPYGRECKAALEWFVAKARSYGLDARITNDNACAYAEIGSGKTCIGILAHLDVVPAGGGWATDPFKMEVENGKLYGRGVSDDKGAAVCCLHVLKAIKDSGTKLNRRVRLIAGTDEERGSSCIRSYISGGNEVPEMSFVPDSEFPVVNSEKGIAHVRLDFADAALCGTVKELSGALVINAVPDSARVVINGNSALGKHLKNKTADEFCTNPVAGVIITDGYMPRDFGIEHIAGGDVVITAKGTAEHASTPEKGDNALWKILSFLSAENEYINSQSITKIHDILATPLAASKLGIYKNDPDSGDVTMCLSQGARRENVFSLSIDFRLPIGVTAEHVIAALQDKTGCRCVLLDYHPNLFYPKDAPLIKTLLGVYRKITGDMQPPIALGGGTYARELPNAVAFGCTPKDLEVNMHRADENFPIAQLLQNCEIYYEAAIELANL